MKVNLSITVKKLCNKRGMTLKDLANKMGIASESLSRTLNGNPQLVTLENIAKCLAIDVRDLFPTIHFHYFVTIKVLRNGQSLKRLGHCHSECFCGLHFTNAL